MLSRPYTLDDIWLQVESDRDDRAYRRDHRVSLQPVRGRDLLYRIRSCFISCGGRLPSRKSRSKSRCERNDPFVRYCPEQCLSLSMTTLIHGGGRWGPGEGSPCYLRNEDGCSAHPAGSRELVRISSVSSCLVYWLQIAAEQPFHAQHARVLALLVAIAAGWP